jgi:hypothetical protein
MAFSEATKRATYNRAGGKCECKITRFGTHNARCNQPLGSNWHAHHKMAVTSGGSDDLENCLAMCIACYQKILTFGKS